MKARVTKLADRRPPATRQVVIVTYPNAQTLDVVGPAEVFATASLVMRLRQPHQAPPYSLQVVATQAGPVTMNSGLRLVADRSYKQISGSVDTLIFSGGEIAAAVYDVALKRWALRQASHVRRLASVCSGAFVLAEAGLLDGKRATTHWSAARLLAEQYPKVNVDADAIYIRDGNTYTSAGVTAGIDLALALVEEDLGHSVALEVARRLVVFLKRPGGQSQFSTYLEAQSHSGGALKDLPEWIVEHLRDDLRVELLAEHAAMSPRHFARVFRQETGVTPAKFVERARVEAARRLLEEEQALGLEEIAARCGFASSEHLRRSLLRHLKVAPHDYRRRFRHTAGLQRAS